MIDQDFRLVARRRAEQRRAFEEKWLDLLAKRGIELDRAALAKAIDWASMVCEGEECWAGTELDRIAPDALDDLDAPLTQAINLLLRGGTGQRTADRNFHRLVSALADPNRRAAWPQELSTIAAWPEEEREISGELYQLIARLETLRLEAREAHIAPRRGRRSKTRDLQAAVHELATFWESLRLSFTIDWLRKGKEWQPISEAACFVHDAMMLITEPRRLPQLKKVTERIRDERNPKLRANPLK